MESLANPEIWIALATLTALELVLGIDNIIFISILAGKLPPEQRDKARQIGIAAAALTRFGLLFTITWIVGLTAPLFTLFDHPFSWRDLILIVGGLFLIWKATKEIHHTVDPAGGDDVLDKKSVATITFGSAIVQIILLDMIFSLDSILTAVGMTDNLAIMVIAVLVAVTAMVLAADPLANFIAKNPTVVMLALGFLLMIGAVLIADGFGVHVPKGYIYAAMAFSTLVEVLNIFARRAKQRAGA